MYILRTPQGGFPEHSPLRELLSFMLITPIFGRERLKLEEGYSPTLCLIVTNT